MTDHIEPAVSWTPTVQALVGLVGVLAIVWLILSVAIASRKLFGKHPPVHEELRIIRNEFQQADNELALAIAAEAQKREKAFEDLQMERQRTLSSLHKKMNGISRNVYLMAGKLGVKPVINSDEEAD
jgi:hypothetical protein